MQARQCAQRATPASPALDPDRLNRPEQPSPSSGPAQRRVASGNTGRGCRAVAGGATELLPDGNQQAPRLA